LRRHTYCTLRFADILEHTGRGYQRRFNARHSLDFRRYIQDDRSTTIPLTLNLRPRKGGAWSIQKLEVRRARLDVPPSAGKVFAQVDCQHRLGHLADLDIELPFMSFVGLSEREEMEVFNVINSKAKGLNASLLDFHDAQLAADLVSERPELFIALYLNNETSSPWYRQLDLGGNITSGLGRRASLRTMQKALKVFPNRTRALAQDSPEATARLVR
jgi:DGQHR domain-containing protein